MRPFDPWHELKFPITQFSRFVRGKAYPDQTHSANAPGTELLDTCFSHLAGQRLPILKQRNPQTTQSSMTLISRNRHHTHTPNLL